MVTAENRRWQENIVAKFKSMLQAASYETKPVDQIFREIDTDDNGKITS